MCKHFRDCSHYGCHGTDVRGGGREGGASEDPRLCRPQHFGGEGDQTAPAEEPLEPPPLEGGCGHRVQRSSP